MVKKCSLLLCFLIATALSQTPEQLKNATDFAIEGISMYTTMPEFKENHPFAELVEDDTEFEHKLYCYRIRDTKGTDVVDVEFLSDTIYRICAYYFPERLEAMGSCVTLAERLVKKIGPVNKSESNITTAGEDYAVAKFVWTFPEKVNRYFALDINNERVILAAINIKQGAKLEKLRKNTDLGF